MPYNNITPFDTDAFNNICIGLGTGFLLSAANTSLCQYFSDKETEKREIEKEKEELINAHKILSILLEKYLKYFYCIVVPLKNRKKEHWSNGTLSIPHFNFTDLHDLSLKISFPNDPIFLTPIELFYEAENNLRKYIINIITYNSLNHFTEIKNIFFKYIECSLANNHQKKILENLKTFTGSEETMRFVNNLFLDSSKDWLIEYEEGRLRNNIMCPYVELYYFLNEEIELITKYNEEIKKITTK